MTQEQLANLVNSTKTSIHRYEVEKTEPSLKMFARIAKHLGCTVSALVSGDYIPIIAEATGGKFECLAESQSAEFIPYPANGRKLFAYKIIGHSMNKLASDGSYAVVDPNQKDAARLEKQPILAHLKGDYTCKILRCDPMRLEPYSTEEYDTIFPSDGCEIVGRVIDVVNPLE